MHPGRSALPFLLLLLLAAATAHAGRPRYADPNDYGPFGVGHTLVDFVDATRGDRTLRTEIWYPVDPEDAVGEPAFYDFQFFGLGLTSPIAIEGAEITHVGWLPMVIFSHGNCGPSWQSTPLVETLASHGMIVLAPNHAGNSVNDCLGTGTPDPFEVAARNRPLDVSFLIDAMLARVADPDDPFYVRVDPRRIGVAGHSFGGYTALAMAAGVDRPDLGIEIEPDPRVRAIAPIAPASGFFSDAELAAIQVPMLLLSATEDTTTPVVPNTTRPWELAGSRPLYRADIAGAGHLHFANLCDIAQALLDFGVREPQVAFLLGEDDYYATCGPTAYPIAEARRIQSFYVTAFLKRHLWWDARYDPFLAPDWALAHEPDVLYSTKEGDQ
jgi:predicted dienelactone hydrolase